MTITYPSATGTGSGAARADAPDPADRRESPLVEVLGASVALGGRSIWAKVDALVATGEFVAILGPNGVGKSTLLKAILGLIPLAAGSINVLGRPVGEMRQDIGYLPQRRSFDASLRIRGRDVVRLGLDGHRWGFPLPGRWGRPEAGRVRELIELVGAGAYADRPIGHLSGASSNGSSSRRLWPATRNC